MANRAPDFFRQLNEQLLEQLEEYARQPGRKGDEVVEWLDGKGVKASRSAVYRWLQDFRIEDDSLRTRAMAALKLAAVTEGDAQAVTEASLRLLDDRVLGKLTGGEDLTPKELQQISFTIGNGVKSRRLVIELREELRAEKAKQKAAIEAGESAKKTGMDPVAAIKKVLLGV